MKYKIDYVIKGSVIMHGDYYNFEGVADNPEARCEAVKKTELSYGAEGLTDFAQEQTPELAVTELPE